MDLLHHVQFACRVCSRSGDIAKNSCSNSSGSLGDCDATEAIKAAGRYHRCSGIRFGVRSSFPGYPSEIGRERVTPADIPEENAVLGEAPTFLVKAEGDLFLVHSIADRYQTDLKWAVEDSDRALLAEVLRLHQAWVSVEILHPQAASFANYRIVGKVIAELLDMDCLALVHPASRKIVLELQPEILDKLKTAHPLHTLFGVPF